MPFDSEIEVRLPGGSLHITVTRETLDVTMRGPGAARILGRGRAHLNVEIDGPRHDLNVVAIVSSEDAIEVMGRTLAQSGDRLSVATDLADGLVRIASQVPDVAFVDVSMGEGAGLAVLHHVRALAPQVTVFALTGAENWL
ncbi:MAG: response regulator [Pseudomonadota bacterium]